MAKQTVHRLLGLEIDEVSLVDRPANQHGLVTITKRDEASMAGTGLYDADGVEYDEDELTPGLRCLDEEGNVRVLMTEEDAERLEAEGYDLDNLDVPDDLSAEEYEAPSLASVGKGLAGGIDRAVMRGSTRALERGGRMRGHANSAFATDLKNDERGYQYAAGGRAKAQAAGRRGGAAALETYGRHPRSVAYGGAAAVTGGTTTAGVVHHREGNRVKKSLGQELLQELSKSYTDSDRDRVIAKAFHAVEDSQAQAQEAWNVAKALEDRAELGEYVELAKSYELPVDPYDLGPILQTIAKSGLSNDQLELVDRVFAAAGDAIYNEQGYTGRGESPTMEYLQGNAYELVGKAAGDVTPEQALVALLDNDDSAYIDYLTEKL